MPRGLHEEVAKSFPQMRSRSQRLPWAVHRDYAQPCSFCPPLPGSWLLSAPMSIEDGRLPCMPDLQRTFLEGISLAD